MPLLPIEQTVTQQFKDVFNTSAQAVVRAPGRVNLIGEYTDLNNGYVLPMAIDRYLAAAVKKRRDRQIRVHAMEFDQTLHLELDHLEKNDHSFQEYITGCLWALMKKGYALQGFDAVISGEIPIGAGLSSSAALELAMLKTAAFASGFSFDPIEMAEVARLAENQWVGVSCGIMDQLTTAAGVAGHALLIDCATLELSFCPVPKNTSVIILDTDTRRGLVDSAYNERRQQCFNAARIMDIAYLRHADERLLHRFKPQMDGQTFLRAHHVIQENERVLATAKAMAKGDVKTIGCLMNQSHESLKHDFQVTNPELNHIVDCSVLQPSCLGARMTGAGFGGCAVALVQKGAENNFINAVTACYTEKTGLTPRIYVCNPSDGVTLNELK